MADRSTSQSQSEPPRREPGAAKDAAPEGRPAFEELLRRHRREAGLTQEALAERARLSARAIAALERGVNRAPRRDTLQLLAQALGAGRAGSCRLRGRRSLGGRRTGPRTHAVPTNLPLTLTSFVGRERELAAVRRLLGQARLLTLTGAGGCGKTRLALEVARALAADAHAAAATCADGIWLVELAALSAEALVPQAVATILSVREQPGQPLLESLSTFLQPQQVLLLDNCEHLAGACAALADALLRVCPRLTILATSREALGLGVSSPGACPPSACPTHRDR
jgi:transcriptional regulator with XRE-family HTH domain